MDPLWKMDAQDLVRGYGEGLFTPTEALSSVLDRAEAVEPVINAFIHMDARQARADAERSWNRWRQKEPRGPLDGVPVSIKDNLHVAGMPTTWGSRLMQGYVAGADERPVARLRAAGAVIFGKTNLPEFAMQGYTSNLIRGTTSNPYDPSLTPGGSSGGAAAAVAAGVGPIALATDGGGSIRRPASYCSLVGLRPSRGAVERAGGLPDIFLDYEVVGPLSRSTADAISLFEALTGRTAEPQADRQLHILYVPRFGGGPVDPEISASVAKAASRLAAMGHKVEEAGAFDLANDVNALWTSLSTTALGWLFSNGGHWPELGGREINLGLCSQNTRNVLSNAETVNAQTIYCLLRSIRDAENKLSALFLDYDVILTPTTAALAWPSDQPFPQVIDGHPVGPRDHAVFSAIANATGLPAISVPVGMTERIGFQMIAPHGADRLLLRLADQYQLLWGGDAFLFPDLGQLEMTA
jgi:aspartyl-tRNA(Asn)/glutamyl-tRNA(Gln) amidotransferase subunit A